MSKEATIDDFVIVFGPWRYIGEHGSFSGTGEPPKCLFYPESNLEYDALTETWTDDQ